VLALKQVRLSYVGDKPVQITLSVSKKPEVTAGDFKVPADVTIANPDLVIAHLTDKSTQLEINATVESGYGYSPAEERQGSSVGTIPTDAIFTPVVKVNYLVEATRVGRVTNFDKLILEITTDGTIDPQAALTSASQTLVNYFQNIVNPQTQVQNSAQPTNSFSPVPKTTSGSTITVEELDLPTRISNALQKSGLDTVASLLSMPKAELAKVKNLGAKSVKIIEAALKERGIDLTD
jgi:DNA-directed RNA polymerase subunit alpha